MLTEEQIEEFYREGYTLARGLISVEAVNCVIAAVNERFSTHDGNEWQAHIFDHANPDKDPDIHELLYYPALVNTVRQIFEAEPCVWYGMLAVVPANGGNGLPWHQDNQYTQIIGSALNCFIALSEITPEKANLWVAPRSHWFGTQPAKINETTAKGHREAVVEPENGICLPTLHPGDVCIFDRQTYHRSLQNTTDTHRYAYAAQYLSESARMAKTGKKDPLRMRAVELAARF